MRTHLPPPARALKSAARFIILSFAIMMTFFIPSGFAQERNVTTFQYPDVASYTGYSIAPTTYDPAATTTTSVSPVYGYIAAGSRENNIVGSVALVHDSVNILEIPQYANYIGLTALPHYSAADSSYGFNFGATGYEDLRATAILTTPSLAGNALPSYALVMQARSHSMSDRILISLFDVPALSRAPSTIATIDLHDANGGNLYPVSAVSDGAQTLYICGFHTFSGAPSYPNEPDMATLKEAFVAMVDLSSYSYSIQYYNTVQNLTAPPTGVPFTGYFFDFDAALQLRWLSGHLIVTGSANGTDHTYWSRTLSSWQVNTSHTWIAELNPSNLNVVSQDFYGLGNVGNYIRPDFIAGMYGVDVVEDVNNAGAYYSIQNNSQAYGYYVSHVDAGMSLSMPSSGSNTFFVEMASEHYRVFGALMQPNSATGSRFTMYGADDNHNFTASFDPTYSSSSGLIALGTSTANLPTSVLLFGNQLSSSILSIQPYWLNGHCAIWSLPHYAARYESGTPYGSPDDLVIMAHSDIGGSGNISPRLIAGDADALDTIGPVCPYFAIISQALTQYIYTANFVSIANQPQFSGGSLDESDQDFGGYAIGLGAFDCKAPYLNPSPYNTTWIYRVNHASNGLPGDKSDPTLTTVWPNPASDYLMTRWSRQLLSTDNVRLVLTDMVGKTVWEGKASSLNGTDARFSLPYISTGMYICSFSLNGQTTHTAKLTIH